VILRLFLDGKQVFDMRAPADFGAREWILAVAAVQVSVEGSGTMAILRAHATGWGAAQVWAIDRGERVDLVLAPDQAPLTLPSLPAEDPVDLDCAARLSMFLDGKWVKSSHLRAADLTLDPRPRAFGHVFCRFLRDGGSEPGFDLTDFLSRPHGAKYERSISATLTVGEVVSYRFT
jgi:hypothetical protein